jgi:glutamyl-tRNA synthetase
VPDQGSTTFEDVVHGEVTWENRVLDDFVILKSDGFPTYHLAHLVDDHLMSISHVLRGDEWISSTPRHVLLYQALGWEPPRFAHLPTILGPDRKKLSKRHGPTGIAAFQEAGYLPEALINYLALCGWSPGTDEEIFSLLQLVERFSLERVSQSGAIFDHDKLDWFNGVYIRSLSVDALAARTTAYLAEAVHRATAPAPEPDDLDQQAQARRAALVDLQARVAARGGMPASVAALVQDRLRTLSDVAELAGFFFDDHIEYDAALLVRQGASPEQIAQALDRAADLAEAIPELTHDALEAAYRALGEELGLKTAQFFMAMRVACTGRTATPPLFETMEALGRSVVVDRLRAGAAHLSETSSS